MSDGMGEVEELSQRVVQLERAFWTADLLIRELLEHWDCARGCVHCAGQMNRYRAAIWDMDETWKPPRLPSTWSHLPRLPDA
jgi:hypothetical protein